MESSLLDSIRPKLDLCTCPVLKNLATFATLEVTKTSVCSTTQPLASPLRKITTSIVSIPHFGHSVPMTTPNESADSTDEGADMPLACINELSKNLHWLLTLFRASPSRDPDSPSHSLASHTRWKKSQEFGSENPHQVQVNGEVLMKSLIPFFTGKRRLEHADPSLSLDPAVQCKPAQWVQLAGHEGSLLPTGTGSLLKEYNECEALCLKQLQFDALRPHVPKYEGEKLLGSTRYVQMQDLLFGVQSPCIMDCKMGTRTFLENEVNDAVIKRDCLRPDMYKKMIAIDPDAPTLDEHRQAAVTKLRYMQWREALSSTASLGFRIEAVKKSEYPTQRDFKLTQSREQVKNILRDFVQSDQLICELYHRRLTVLKSSLESSRFFAEHELIGTSLLFAHRGRDWANVWMIDFAKTVHHPGLVLSHGTQWLMGNHEDGYLIGLNNLIDLFHTLSCELS
ncbi:Inositol-trisphosphate 3-kinase B [Clonorchis sinensis]|uniref:Kinase n=1 Tax=Clonorchis sinensis TaxID=79923 RepID=A0A8T1MPJ3_CLOSI|nr:Inositol-trisphosphate 3-kinase B [Clonorchis sinensis]